MGVIIASLDLHAQNSDETNVRIISFLRAVLIEHELWDEEKEATWKDVATPEGDHYVLYDWTSLYDYADADELINSAIHEYEGDLFEIGIITTTDPDQGMYWIEYQ